jgi:hypothetical protein
MYYMVTATYKGDVLSKLHEYAKGDNIRKLREFAKEHHPKLPDGIEHIDTWVGVNGHRHFQLLKTNDESLLQEWTKQLDDLFDFEIDHVVHAPSSETDGKAPNMN